MIRELDPSRYQAYFFDLDGTIYTGSKLLPGAGELIARLHQLGKKVMYLTNTTVYTREQCRARLQDMGLNPEREDIMTAGYVAATYLLQEQQKVQALVIGERALTLELNGKGIMLTEDPLSATHLVVGLDREFTYDKLAAGMTAVRNGARFIVANPDPFCPVPGGIIPDSWPIAKAIEAASTLRIHAMTGKPSAYYTDLALRSSGLEAERCLMIGDRLETDMMMGVNSGVHTALVLTGVTTPEDLRQSNIVPDYVFATLADLLKQV
ncbi:HAD-IIA family hydrolase [Paenibacillus jiagnxiensis]|uniref:HAD-IIA family hydrolase n=1 Tax=Paenibacillus jiagnxiensis TaxID=3228926 RepID=UPI003494036F